MCGRFTLKTSPQAISMLFDDLELESIDFKPRYNIAPTQEVLAVRTHQPQGRQFAFLRWGLIPFWAEDPSIGSRLINARAESVAEKPAFRQAFGKRRCLIVADGFFEWKTNGKRKQPYYITAANRQPFCFAGLWESWTDKQDGRAVESCTIITTEASPGLRSLHDRMPSVVPPERFRFWLDPDFKSVEALREILTRSAFDWRFAPVNPVVNNARHDQPDCIQELSS